MTAHDHRTSVEGCFRCELSADEATADEVQEAIAPHVRRLANEAPAVTFMYVGYGYSLVKNAR